jgi:predicted nucleic acid-binding Zn ribbon protein
MVDAKSIKDKVSKKINNARSKMGTQLPAHKHCRMCGIDIKATSEDRVCKSAECAAALDKRGRNDRMMRVMFFVFVLIFFAPILLSAMGFVG